MFFRFTVGSPPKKSLTICYPEKKIRGTAAKFFFRFTDGFSQKNKVTVGSQKNKVTVGFPTKKKFRRACAPEFFLSKSVFYIIIIIYFYKIQ